MMKTPGRSGEKKFAFMENSLDVIRLLAALQVAVSHYLNLMLLYYREPGTEDTLLLGFKRCITLFPGVVILFTISGFLMGATLERETSRSRFLKKRFLRIYPALWVNILLTGALIAAALKPGAEQMRALSVWGAVQAFGIAFTPGFLKDFGAGSINGALWTIMVEIQFYLLLFLFWNYCKKKSDRWWQGALIAALICNLVSWLLTQSTLVPQAVLSLLDRSFLPYLCWFLLGMNLYRLREKAVPLLVRKLPVLTVVYVIYKGCWQHFSWAVPGYYADVVTTCLLPCAVIGFAYAFGAHRLKNDISYGIFLYHWPVINVIFYFGMPAAADHFLLLAGYTAVFLALAALSWLLLERRLVRRR